MNEVRNKIQRKYVGFSYSKNLANFEAFVTHIINFLNISLLYHSIRIY